MSSNSKKSKEVIHHLGPKARQQNYQPNHSIYLSGAPSISVSPHSNQLLSSSQIVLNPSLTNNLAPHPPAPQSQQIIYSEAHPAIIRGGVQPQNLIINQSQPQHMIIGQLQPHTRIIGQTQPQNLMMGSPQNVVMMDPQPQNFIIGQGQMASGLRSSQVHSVINGERSVEYVPFEKTIVDVVPMAKVETVTVPKVATDYIALERQIEYQPISKFETVKEVVPRMRTDYEERVYEEVVPVSRTEYVPVDRVEERMEYAPVRRQRIISPEELHHSQYREEYMPPPPPSIQSDRVIHHGTFYSDPLPSHPPFNSYNELPPLHPFDYNHRFMDRPYAYNERHIDTQPPPYNEYPLPAPPPISYKERMLERPPPSSLLYRDPLPSPYDHPPPFQNRFYEYSHPTPYWNEFYYEGGEKYGPLASTPDTVRGRPHLEKDYRPFNDRSYPPLFNEFSGVYSKPFDKEIFYNDAPYGYSDEKFREKKERKWKGIDGRF